MVRFVFPVTAAALAAVVLSPAVWPVARAEQIGGLVVPVVGAEADGIPVPSVAATFGSFAEVSAAMTADRERLVTLEKRLAELEGAGKAAEALPPPAEKDGGEAAGDKPKPEGQKKQDEKQPYEVGSDKKTTTSWADGFQAQSANKDFRVKIGGRS